VISMMGLTAVSLPRFYNPDIWRFVFNDDYNILRTSSDRDVDLLMFAFGDTLDCFDDPQLFWVAFVYV
jgi:hypothetical protein